MRLLPQTPKFNLSTTNNNTMRLMHFLNRKHNTEKLYFQNLIPAHAYLWYVNNAHSSGTDCICDCASPEVGWTSTSCYCLLSSSWPRTYTDSHLPMNSGRDWLTNILWQTLEVVLTVSVFFLIGSTFNRKHWPEEKEVWYKVERKEGLGCNRNGLHKRFCSHVDVCLSVFSLGNSRWESKGCQFVVGCLSLRYQSSRKLSRWLHFLSAALSAPPSSSSPLVFGSCPTWWRWALKRSRCNLRRDWTAAVEQLLSRSPTYLFFLPPT